MVNLLCTNCNRAIKPVVAVDIDGTLGDYHGHFLHFAEEWLNKRVDVRGYDGSTDLASWLDVDKETYRKIKLAYRQGGMKRSMPIFDGARSLIIELQTAGAEVWMTTTRPYLRLDNVDPDTREWLDRNQIPYDGLIYDEDKYKVLMEIVGRSRIVGVLDDDPEQYFRARHLGLNPIFAFGYYNSGYYNSGIRHRPYGATLTDAQQILVRRVKDWYEANKR